MGARPVFGQASTIVVDILMQRGQAEVMAQKTAEGLQAQATETLDQVLPRRRRSPGRFLLGAGSTALAGGGAAWR